MADFFKYKIFRTELILLFPVVLLTILFRLPSYIPFTWKSDELDYLTAVREILNGGILYISYGDLKPPLLFWLYSLASQLGGGIDIVTIKTMGIFFSVVTAVAMFFLAKQLTGNRLAFISALIFAVFSTCARGEEMLATNSELLMNGFIVPAYCLFFIYLKDRNKNSVLMGSALLLVGGFLINQKAGINLLVFMSILFYLAIKTQQYEQFIKPFLQLVVVFLLPILVFLLYYARIDGLDEIYYWLVKMPSAYIGSYDITSRFDRISTRFVIFFTGFWALLIPFALGLWLIFKRRWYQQALWLTLILYLFFSIFAVVVGGKMMERYFIQLLPAFFVFSAVGLLAIYDAIEHLKITKKTPIKILLQMLLAAILLVSPLQYVQQHQNTSKTKQDFLVNKPSMQKIKNIVHKNSTAQDKIFVFPKDRYYYYFLERRIATRFNEIETHLSQAKMYPQENELFNQGWDYLFQDLIQNQPKFIIDISGEFGFQEGEPGHIRKMKEQLKDYIQNYYMMVGNYSGDKLYQLIP